ncbi:hypothetical protein SNE40_009729 [Patella caerulea]|uniref:Chromo domain-containing protein n=1 Tax=Patella caerulea TaxID=87958 RepID=A0AAN8JW63_PATCE
MGKQEIFIGVESVPVEETLQINRTATNKEYEVWKIMKRMRRGVKYEFLLRWKGFPSLLILGKRKKTSIPIF